MSVRPMSLMREMVETQYQPVLEMCRADLVPQGRLLAGGLEMLIAHYGETFRAMDERHKKLGWYSFCLTPELFLAMDILPFLGESHPVIVTRGTPEACIRSGSKTCSRRWSDTGSTGSSASGSSSATCGAARSRCCAVR